MHCPCEVDNTVTPFRYDAAAGKLTVLDGMTISLLPKDTEHSGGGGAAEITISKDGRYAYASVRCTGGFNASEAAVFNTIAVLALDSDSGKITLTQNVESGGNMPWTHTFAEDDSLLLVQNQYTKHTGLSEEDCGENDGHNGLGPGQIVLFRRDEAGGGLERIGTTEVPQAMSILAICK